MTSAASHKTQLVNAGLHWPTLWSNIGRSINKYSDTTGNQYSHLDGFRNDLCKSAGWTALIKTRHLTQEECPDKVVSATVYI